MTAAPIWGSEYRLLCTPHRPCSSAGAYAHTSHSACEAGPACRLSILPASVGPCQLGTSASLVHKHPADMAECVYVGFRLTGRGQVSAVTFSPSGDRLAVLDGPSATLQVFPIAVSWPRRLQKTLSILQPSQVNIDTRGVHAGLSMWSMLITECLASAIWQDSAPLTAHILQ